MIPAFFGNSANVRLDDHIVVNHCPGNQYNFYNGRRRSSIRPVNPVPSNVHHGTGRQPRRPEARTAQRPSEDDLINALTRPNTIGVNLSHTNINIVHGRIRCRYGGNQAYEQQGDVDSNAVHHYQDVEMSGVSTDPVPPAYNDRVTVVEHMPQATEQHQDNHDVMDLDSENSPAARNVDPKPNTTTDNGQLSPIVGAYVIVRINKNATANQSPIATLALRNMEDEYFVGYLDTIKQSDESEPDGPDYLLHLLREAPPDSPTECITPQMCVPVLPTSTTIPQSSREALRPNQPLPWANCYHSSFDVISVRVCLDDAKPTGHETTITSLPPSEVRQHVDYQNADWKDRDRSLKSSSAKVSQAKKELQALRFGTGSSANVTLDDEALERAKSNVAAATKLSKSMKNSLAKLQKQYNSFMTVDISYDLSSVKVLPDPQKLISKHIYLANM